MIKSIKYGAVSAVLMCLLAATSLAQSGPYSAQIQRALAAWGIVNGAAGQISVPLSLPDGTVGAPSLTFASDTTKGLYSNNTNQISLTLASTQRYIFSASALQLINDNGSFQLGAASDVIIARDAANTLAQRNSTNAQQFNIYNTFTDPTHNEFLALIANSAGGGYDVISKAGSAGGNVRDLRIGTGGSAGTLYFRQNGTNYWKVVSSGSGGALATDAGFLALGTTSTDGIVLQNTTAATGGATVQMSPRIKWSGTAWNSMGSASETDYFVAEVLPSTAAGTTSAVWRLGSSIAGGAVGNYFSLNGGNGLATFPGAVISSGNFQTDSGHCFTWGSRGFVCAGGSDGLINIENNGQSVGPQINTGTAAPTVTTCGTGSVTAHSTNTAGEVTATGATTCTVTFGAPNFTNQPFCTVTDETTAAALRISAISVSAFTVTNLTSGDKFMFHCVGGI